MTTASKAKKIVFILQINGAPCSGKGTMVKMLLEHFKETRVPCTVAATSRYLAERRDGGGEYATEIGSHMSRGTTVPGLMTASVIAPAVTNLIKSFRDERHLVVFDGYLRTREQVDSIFGIKSQCESTDVEVVLLPAFALQVSDDKLKQRQECQRAEQQSRSDHDKFEARLSAYKDGTLPSITYYSDRLRVGTVSVYADCGKDEVFRNLRFAIRQTMK